MVSPRAVEKLERHKKKDNNKPKSNIIKKTQKSTQKSLSHSPIKTNTRENNNVNNTQRRAWGPNREEGRSRKRRKTFVDRKPHPAQRLTEYLHSPPSLAVIFQLTDQVEHSSIPMMKRKARQHSTRLRVQPLRTPRTEPTNSSSQSSYIINQSTNQSYRITSINE